MEIDIPEIENLPLIKAYVPYSNGGIIRIVNLLIPKKPGIYLLYDKNKNLLYIGQTEDLMRRIIQHRKKMDAEYTKFFVCPRSIYYRIAVEHFLTDKYNPLLAGKNTGTHDKLKDGSGWRGY